VALTANSVDLGMGKVGAARVLVTLDRARAVFDLRELAIYGGGVTGQFVVNGRKGLSVGGDLRFAGIALQPMLSGLAGYDRLTGTGDVGLKFLAVGNSQATLMQGLSGSGTLSLTKGELGGVDVPNMLRTLDTSYVGADAKTVYDAATGSFGIEGGVLRNDDLVLAAPGLTATGKGTIGIGARNLDYRLRPTAVVKGGSADGVSVPLLITGPWESPKFRLDLEAVAQEKLEAEAAELKAKAEAKLAEKLGIEAQEGENLEDAARRKLDEAIEDEAAKALERLLGIGD
jgi:AsmA protein